MELEVGVGTVEEEPFSETLELDSGGGDGAAERKAGVKANGDMTGP